MPGLYRDEGVVLRAIKLGEADRIVTIFTQGHGKIRAVAKGIRKTTSKFGARLEPMSRVALQCYKGRDLDIVTQAESLDSNRVLREEYALLTRSVPMLEAVDQVAQDREPNPALYRMLTGALHALATTRNPLVTPAFFWKLLSLEGFPSAARRLRALRRATGRSDGRRSRAGRVRSRRGRHRLPCVRAWRWPSAHARRARVVATGARWRAQRCAGGDAGTGRARGRASRCPRARASRRAPAPVGRAALNPGIRPPIVGAGEHAACSLSGYGRGS